MDPNTDEEIRSQIVGIRPGRYPRPLPLGLAPWYVYTLDGGHQIACWLAGHEDEGLLPVPVKAVLRSYSIVREHVVVDLPYDPELGLVTDAEDDEF